MSGAISLLNTALDPGGSYQSRLTTAKVSFSPENTRLKSATNERDVLVIQKGGLRVVYNDYGDSFTVNPTEADDVIPVLSTVPRAVKVDFKSRSELEADAKTREATKAEKTLSTEQEAGETSVKSQVKKENTAEGKDFLSQIQAESKTDNSSQAALSKAKEVYAQQNQEADTETSTVSTYA